MRGSRALTLGGVNARFTSLRWRAWSGGSADSSTRTPPAQAASACRELGVRRPSSACSVSACWRASTGPVGMIDENSSGLRAIMADVVVARDQETLDLGHMTRPAVSRTEPSKNGYGHRKRVGVETKERDDLGCRCRHVPRLPPVTTRRAPRVAFRGLPAEADLRPPAANHVAPSNTAARVLRRRRVPAPRRRPADRAC